MSRKKQIVKFAQKGTIQLLPKGTVPLGAGLAVTFFIGILITSLTAWKLGPTGLGDYTNFTITNTILQGIASYGFFTSAQTMTSDTSPHDTKINIFRERVDLSIYLSLIISACSAAYCFFSESESLFYQASIIFSILCNAVQPGWILLVDKRFNEFSALQSLQRGAQLCTLLALLTVWENSQAIYVALACSQASTIYYFFSTNKHYLKEYKPAAIFSKDRISHAFKVFISDSSYVVADTVSYASSNVISIILIGFGQTANLGIYALSDKIKSYIITCFTPSVTAKYSEISSLISLKSYSIASKALKKYLISIFTASVLLSGLCTIFANKIVILLGGASFESSAALLRIMAPFFPLSILGLCMQTLYYSSQRMAHFNSATSILRTIILALVVVFQSTSRLNSLAGLVIAYIASESVAYIVIYWYSAQASRIKLA